MNEGHIHNYLIETPHGTARLTAVCACGATKVLPSSIEEYQSLHRGADRDRSYAFRELNTRMHDKIPRERF